MSKRNFTSIPSPLLRRVPFSLEAQGILKAALQGSVDGASTLVGLRGEELKTGSGWMDIP